MVCADTDGGISEVVSALLMVAIVVILAAIVASIVFGVELPDEPKAVAVTATRSGDTITFVNHGGMDTDRVAEIRCWIGGVDPANDNFALGAKSGAIETYTAPGAVRVVVVGKSIDNDSWILLDKTL